MKVYTCLVAFNKNPGVNYIGVRYITLHSLPVSVLKIEHSASPTPRVLFSARNVTLGGVHQLHVTILDIALPGSPMSIPVSIPTKMRDTPVKTIGTGLNKPSGTDVTDDGQVIVCEHDGHCITVIDSKRSDRLVPMVVREVSFQIQMT